MNLHKEGHGRIATDAEIDEDRGQAPERMKPSAVRQTVSKALQHKRNLDLGLDVLSGQAGLPCVCQRYIKKNDPKEGEVCGPCIARQVLRS